MTLYLVPALDGVAYGLLLFVVGAGLTLCFGVADILNLAHGLLYAIGAYLAAALSDGTWTTLACSVAAGTAAAAVGGALLAGLLAPIAEGGHLWQALLTFGFALIGGHLLVLGFGSHDLPVRLPESIDQPVLVLGHAYPGYRLVFIALAAAVAVGLYAVIARTRAGSIVRAAADDRDMVACCGIDPRAVRLGVLTASGALAGLAGALGAPIIGPGPSTASTVLLLSLVVVVLGGLGSIGGALVAAITIGEIQTLGVTVMPQTAPFLLFAAMALVLAGRESRRAGMA
ncbi:MAG: branched-chain amino acid ABC transporter permease [Micromonosporaceae bacterium]|nr:branched-chain amino acid ABC transporter permease [Micromonosporaceae bacterium]